jgi:hypothetical protein
MAAREKKLPADLAKVDLLIRAKEANEKLLLSKPHVIGLDVGYRIKNGKTTDERVVIVYVSRKVERSDLAEGHVIPKTLKIGNQRVPVDVVEGAIDQPCLFTLRSRPLRGGSSIGPVHLRLTGTGGVCVTLNDGNTYILTNNHVIADINRAPIGTGVVQPSVPDGGTALNDTVAALFDFVPLDFGTTTVTLFGVTFTLPNPNYVDAAIAQVTNRYNDGNREVHWVGYPQPLRRGGWNLFEKLALLGRRVCKMGRTTEFTIGKVVSVSYDHWVGPYANGLNAWFKNQVRIEGENGPFARGGDSGSLVVDFETRRPIGLLFSIRGDSANANPIHEVLGRLNIPQL